MSPNCDDALRFMFDEKIDTAGRLEWQDGSTASEEELTKIMSSNKRDSCRDGLIRPTSFGRMRRWRTAESISSGSPLRSVTWGSSHVLEAPCIPAHRLRNSFIHPPLFSSDIHSIRLGPQSRLTAPLLDCGMAPHTREPWKQKHALCLVSEAPGLFVGRLSQIAANSSQWPARCAKPSQALSRFMRVEMLLLNWAMKPAGADGSPCSHLGVELGWG